MSFALSAALDTTALAGHFADHGYVSIASVLPEENARRMYKALNEFASWNMVFNNRGRHVDLPAAQIHAMLPQKLHELQTAIYQQASSEFQYLYDDYPIFDAHREGRNREHALHKFYEWLDDQEFLDFARKVTGFDDISFVDAQATRYRPGHFLTTHDDDQQDKNRRAAYVFNFTPEWLPDWGGYLQLLDDEGHVRRGLRPAFNVLNLLAVPQRHNVSIVAPFCTRSRLSITGWLRYGDKQA
ncbi:MAG: 2OG-Fe(II) oxygenase family protein [Woeseiaceae bacterium]|nr:2OG-Fe(II) oxygenase family protein [Woeseiaceae bacterium]